MRIKATIAYDGRAYCGFQTQPRGGSVQDALQKALTYLTGTDNKIRGAGRTDAGVSARGQVIAFDVDALPRGPEAFRKALNRLLPKDIYCLSVTQTDQSFDPRKDAVAKVYAYRFSYPERDPLKPFVAPIAVPKFVFDSYRQTISLYLGRHDFRAFTTKTNDRFDFVRTLYRADAIQEPNGNIITVFIGDGFMTYMARILVGVAIRAATGKLTLKEVEERLTASPGKARFSFKAPAAGLMLEKVLYDASSLEAALTAEID